MLLHLVYICFAILQSSFYVEAVGYFLILLEYFEQVGHPALPLLRMHVSHFVGEDIELANRSLSQSTKSVKGRSEVDTLDRSYRILGCMLPIAESLRPMILQVRSLTGWSQNKRLLHRDDETVITKAKQWVSTLIDSLEDGKYQHYRFIRPEEKGKRGRPRGSKKGMPSKR
jgi:hypothetical protein